MLKPHSVLLLLILTGIALPGFSKAQQGHPKVALVLSGGGARAASHIGVLKVLERERIPIDCIAGTSFGALAGGLFSIGYSAVEIEQIFLGQDWNDIFSGAPQRQLTPLVQRRNARYQGQLAFRGWEPELPTGLVGGQRLTEALDALTTERMLHAQFDFDNLPVQFRAVSTNLIDGRPFVFEKGSMTEALRASIAVPFLFTPLEKDGMLLVDGGLVNNLPVDIALSLGADIVIAVDATSPLLEKDEINNFVDVIDQSISLQMERNVEENSRLATIILKPDLQRLTNTDYEHLPEIIKRGEAEAKRVLDELKALVEGIPPRAAPKKLHARGSKPVIGYVSFKGLKRITAEQLAQKLEVSAGEAVNPSRIESDVVRLYATQLFDSVRYDLEPIGEDRYQLVYIVEEAPLHLLGASLRYDNGYDFTALAEFTARQLFDTPSSATISTQFGGIDHHFGALRYVPSPLPFLFFEPRGDVLRIERLDIRDKTLVDRFIDKREGGRFSFGGLIMRDMEVSAGFMRERVRISGGSAPNTLAGSDVLAGFTLRANRDTLDDQEFPDKGMVMRFGADSRNKSLGSAFEYSKWTLDYRRYFSLSGKSTLQINTSLGYTTGNVPFYDQFFIGGYYFTELGSRPFVGLERDELTARQMAIFGATYRRQIFSTPFGFVRRGFLTGVYNGVYSTVRQRSPYNLDLFNGAGLGVELDTMLGPVRAVGGWGEGSRFNFYISLGPAF